jgi:hypothetical protein
MRAVQVFFSSWLSALNVSSVFAFCAIRTFGKRPPHFADNPLFGYFFFLVKKI